MKSRAYNVMAVCLLLAASGYVIVHALSGSSWPGFARLADVVAAFYVPIWIAAAVGLALRTRWSATVALPASLFLFFHGCAINTGGSKMGLVLIAGGVASALLLFLGEPWKTAELRQVSGPERESFHDTRRAA